MILTKISNTVIFRERNQGQPHKANESLNGEENAAILVLVRKPREEHASDNLSHSPLNLFFVTRQAIDLQVVHKGVRSEKMVRSSLRNEMDFESYPKECLRAIPTHISQDERDKVRQGVW